LWQAGFTYIDHPALARKASWYAMRAAGMTSYTLLWLSTTVGLLVSSRRFRKHTRVAVTWHEFLSVVALLFAIWHGATIYLDTYLQAAWWQVWTPFTLAAYRPLAVGLGQVGFYLMVIVTLSFYVRHRIGGRRWRQLHYATLILYGLALTHAIAAGSDTAWTRWFYIGGGSSTIFLVYSRILAHARPGKQAQPSRKVRVA